MDAYTSREPGAAWTPPGQNVEVSNIFRQITSILRRRWLMIATIILVIFGAALVTAMMLTPKYEAVVRIKIDPSPGAAMGQMSEQTSFPDQAIVDTEVTVMQSLDVARSVVRKLGLERDPEFSRGLQPLASNAPRAAVDARRDQVATAVLGATTAKREKATYIVELTTASEDPVKAARIANTFASQYIEASLGRRSGTAEKQAGYLQEQLKTLSQQATAADAQLTEYRARAGVIGSGGGASTLTDQQIAPLAMQFATAQSEAAAAAAKIRSAQTQIGAGGIGGVSAVLNSDVIRNLRAQRAVLQQEQGEVMTRYGPKHPETLKITQQLTDIDNQINEEAKRIIAGLGADGGSASARAQSLASDLGKLRAQQARDTRSSAMADTYQRQADSAQAAYNRLAEKAQASSQAASSSIALAQIIEDAVAPTTPSKPNKKLLLAVGLLGAIAAALGAVAILEIVNTGIMSVTDVQNLGLQSLATVPRLSKSQREGGEAPADLIYSKPVGSYAEAYRTVRSSLILGHQNVARVITIASTLPDEGKTTATLSLARVMALAGERTIAIDCDLRRAGLTKAVGLVSEHGLIEVLRGEVTLESAIKRDPSTTLDVLPLAGEVFSPEDMFSGDAMPNLLAKLRERYDHIILDTPPLLGVADARSLAVMSDAVAMVIKWNATPRNAVRAALEMLRHDEANLVGAILSMVDRSTEAYGALYYSQKYTNYYKESA
ncbi:MAG: capsular exopolysaccharide family [Sphingomonadales bacterium]|nr:capsular exopolysaccharide family [Sphingomonadales bacterium]